MTNKERIEEKILQYQLLVNFLTYTTMDKSLSGDALGLRIKSRISQLIESELGPQFTEVA